MSVTAQLWRQLYERLSLSEPPHLPKVTNGASLSDTVPFDGTLTFGHLDLIHLAYTDKLKGWFIFRDGTIQQPLQIGKIRHAVWGGGDRWSIRFYYQAERSGSWQCLWREEFKNNSPHQLLGNGVLTSTIAIPKQAELPVVVSRPMGSFSYRPEISVATCPLLEWAMDGQTLWLVPPLLPRQDNHVWQYLPICQATVDCGFNIGFEQVPFLWNYEAQWQDVLAA